MLSDHERVARLLEELADLEELRGTQYKPRAYRRAARNLHHLDTPLAQLHAEGRLGGIEGVGDAIEDKIAQALETGTIDTLERVREEVPVDVRTLGQIRGLGPNKLAKLYEELDVTTLDELEQALAEGRVTEVPGFGPKTRDKIAREIQRVRQASSRWLSASVDEEAETIQRALEDDPVIERVGLAGALRRRHPLVEGITLVATAQNEEAALDAFCSLEVADRVEARGARRASIRVAYGPPVELVVVEPGTYGAALLVHTGSDEHVQRLREHAADRGLVLTEAGLEDASGRAIQARNEADVYEGLDLSFVEPELREATGEVEAARQDRLPDLVEVTDIRGDLQMHTHYSDGAQSVEAMARKADELGYEYILLTDHGPSLTVANAPSLEELSRQGEEVDEINADESIGVTVLQGVEANVTPDGIDVPEEVCRNLDLVVASLHDTVDDATERVVQAMEDYTVDVLGHPTNRRLTEREGNTLDVPRIVSVARDNDVAIEINAQPDRLDLDWTDVRRFRGEVDFVVSTDAHSPKGMEQVVYGVQQARKGWLSAEHVANAQPLEELLDRLGRGGRP